LVLIDKIVKGLEMKNEHAIDFEWVSYHVFDLSLYLRGPRLRRGVTEPMSPKYSLGLALTYNLHFSYGYSLILYIQLSLSRDKHICRISKITPLRVRLRSGRAAHDLNDPYIPLPL
jgi:hypothetical protein